MDSLAHGLYGAAIFKKKKSLFWWVLVTGMIPDIIVIFYDEVWTHRVYPILQQLLELRLTMPPSYYLYYITHSFITTLIIFISLRLIRKELSILAFPLALHILFDIPFHCGVFATRFFYPISNFNICGYSYTDFNHAWLWPVNYIIIGLLYYFLRRREKRQNRKRFL